MNAKVEYKLTCNPKARQGNFSFGAAPKSIQPLFNIGLLKYRAYYVVSNTLFRDGTANEIVDYQLSD